MPCVSALSVGVTSVLLVLLIHAPFVGTMGARPLAWLAGGTPARGDVPPVPFDRGHEAWSALLAQYVRNGVVDYRGLSDRGQPALDDYLNSLAVAASSEPTWVRSERMAFWINAYNAYTVRLILDHYPLRSIRTIGFLPLAAFRTRFIPLGAGRKLITLNTIENEILRAQFQDARVHFTIVCASKSCPDLRSEAYRSIVLDQQLDGAARGFLNDPSRNHWEPASRTLHLSSIFKWFRGDFEREDRTLAAFVRRYLPLAGAGPADAPPRIEFLDYDWSLNGK